MLVVVALPLLAVLGVIGAGEDHLLHGERFDAKQIVVAPVGTDGLRVTETVDIDFARTQRHGYQRVVPNDLGVPTDIEATSTADATVGVETTRTATRIRIGTAHTTFDGRQRYVLSYTHPEAQLSTGRLSLDLIGVDEELATKRLDVWIGGFDLDDVECDRGRWAEEGGCDVVRRDGLFMVRIDDLEPGDGVTINADIVDRVAFVEPPIEPRPAGWSLRWAFAGVLLAVCLASIGVLYLFSRWYGTNRVGGSAGMGAAFPDSESGFDADAVADAAARRVADANLGDLAAIEFAPPDGMRPWQGALAVNEVIDERSVIAWFSEMIANGALELHVDNFGSARLRRGEGGADLAAADYQTIAVLFEGGDTVQLSNYSEALSAAWVKVARDQQRFAFGSGWWHRDVPTFHLQRPAFRLNWSVISFVAVVYCVASLLLFQSLVTPLTPLSILLSFPAVCIGLAVGLTAYAAYRAFAPIRPARTVVGTAAAVRVLGFRKFLEQSEGRHVEEAWHRDRIREYSAWAVALDAATAWGDQVRLVAPKAEPVQLEWVASLDRVATALDFDTVSRVRASRYERRANPWRAIGRAASRYAENAKANSGRGGWGGGSGGSGRSGGSRGVGSGGGGGSSGSW